MRPKSKRPLSQTVIPRGQLRSRLRHATLTTLARLSARQTQNALKKNRVQNLYFHFLPEKDVDNFLALIKKLSRGHNFVPYSEAVARIQSGDIDKPYLSISFDDGFESNLRAGKLLAEHGISACFFICPDMVGKNRETLKREFSGDIGEEKRMMTWTEIDHLLALGHEIGSHTLDHTLLTDQSGEDARMQVIQSKTKLDSRVGETRHFAWPRGQFHHFRKELIDTVFDAGYESCASAVRGSHLTKMQTARGNIRRENCVASWPISHTLYLLGRSIRQSDESIGSWPARWRQAK